MYIDNISFIMAYFVYISRFGELCDAMENYIIDYKVENEKDTLRGADF